MTAWRHGAASFRRAVQAGPPEELGHFIRNEIEKWGKVVASAGMQKQ